MVAPYEADAQLAYLAGLPKQKGGIVAVISEDSDLLAYGCKSVRDGFILIRECDIWTSRRQMFFLLKFNWYGITNQTGGYNRCSLRWIDTDIVRRFVYKNYLNVKKLLQSHYASKVSLRICFLVRFPVANMICVNNAGWSEFFPIKALCHRPYSQVYFTYCEYVVLIVIYFIDLRGRYVQECV